MAKKKGPGRPPIKGGRGMDSIRVNVRLTKAEIRAIDAWRKDLQIDRPEYLRRYGVNAPFGAALSP